MKKYKIVTYGCQMNVHESEKLAGMLESIGYKSTDNINNADVIVFNTCTIREGAVDKAFGNIGALKKLKHKNENLVIAVGGCMTQNKSDSLRLKKTFPFISIIFGTHNLHEFKQYLVDYNLSKERIYEIWEDNKNIPDMTEITRTSGYNAYVNIMFGCNNFCSYCIVPYVRGRERSRDNADIIKEVTKLVKDGYKIITLLGQNVNSYGNDKSDNNISFSNLLRSLSDVPGDFKITFMTSHPKDLNDEVIKTIASSDKFLKHIHLPVQSGNNDVLKKMNRGYTVEHYINTINEIRKHIPDVAISSDFIVGFPGETEKAFNDTYSLIENIEYDNIYAYMFSERSGTRAEKYNDKIDITTKNTRVNKLLSLQRRISKDRKNAMLGKIYSVISDKTLDNTTITRADSGRTIIVNDVLRLNEFYNVIIKEIKGNKIIAEIV